MSGNLAICSIGEELTGVLKAFRYRKALKTSAIILKVVKESLELVIDEELDGCSIDEIKDSLPEHQPRFVLISYRMDHSDGRISMPLCLVYHSPSGGNPELQMMYAGSRNNLSHETGITKDIEVRDLDDLTDEYIQQKLSIS